MELYIFFKEIIYVNLNFFCDHRKGQFDDQTNKNS